MAPVDSGKFNVRAVVELAAALGIRRTGAYAFVAYAGTPLDLSNLHVRGFTTKCLRNESGVGRYRTINRISTRQRGTRPRPAFREIKGQFFAAKLLTPHAYAFITPERDDYVRDGLVRFLYRARSWLTRARLTSGEMQETVYELARLTNTKVETSRYLLRSRQNEATIGYQTESLKSLYDFARENHLTVQGFDFSLVGSDGEVLVRAGLNRDGKLSYHGGSKEFFVKQFIEAVAQKVKSRADVLNGRARSEESGDVKPLRLKFDRALFDRTENVHALLTALSRIRHSDYTLLHRNPYLHLSFFDFFDASEFDILVDAADSLVIVPQFESSLSSLFRLCQKIFDKFEEGTVAEAGDVVRTASIPPGWDE